MNYYLIPIYIDKSSKESLITMNDLLIKINVNISLKVIIESLEYHSGSFVATQPKYKFEKLKFTFLFFNSSIFNFSRSLSYLSMYAIDILNGLLLSLKRHGNEDVINAKNEFSIRIVACYSNFVYTSCAYSKTKDNNLQTIIKKISSILEKKPQLVDIFVNVFENNMLVDGQNEFSDYSLLLAGLLIRHLKATSQSNETIDKLKNQALDYYVKKVLGSKSKPESYFIDCSNYFCRYLTRDDFDSKIVNVILRLLLRNPEIVLEMIAKLIEQMTIDMSDFSEQLITNLATQLLAKDQHSQHSALDGIKSLSKQCSNTESVVLIIKHLFRILNGSGSNNFYYFNSIKTNSSYIHFSQKVVYQQLNRNVSFYQRLEVVL
jgi:hypothetical protein